MVVEESIIKTLEKETVSWKLAVGSKNNPEKPQRIVDSTKIDGEIYSDLSTVHSILESRLNTFLNNTILEVQKREKVWYGTTSKINQKQSGNNKPQSSVNQNNATQNFQNTTQNGKTNGSSTTNPPTPAPNNQNLKIDPDSFLDDEDTLGHQKLEDTNVHSIESHTSVDKQKMSSEATERLRRMVLGDEEPEGHHPNIAQTSGEKIQIVDEIQGPDGTIIPVNFRM